MPPAYDPELTHLRALLLYAIDHHRVYGARTLNQSWPLHLKAPQRALVRLVRQADWVTAGGDRRSVDDYTPGERAAAIDAVLTALALEDA